MELGQRLKQARLDMGMSQRQLCGEEITRNMLSQIENGSARPSMTTLAYLARRLEKPISYFLEEQSLTSPNQQLMTQARQDYTAGQYRQALESLEGYRGPDETFDPERWLLEALCLMGLSQQVLQDGKNIYALSLLQKAAQAGKNSPYHTAAVERERVLLLYQTDPDRAAALAGLLPEDDREPLLRAEAFLQKECFSQCARVLEAIQNRTARWHYLRGQAALGEKDYALAAEHYLQAEEDYPLSCAKALEECYRELEDYKLAYHYACKQRQE